MIEFQHKLPAMNIDGKHNGTYNNRELGFPSILTTTDPKLGLFLHCMRSNIFTDRSLVFIDGKILMTDKNQEKLFEDYEVSSLNIFPRSRDLPYFKKWRQKIASFAPAGADVQKQIECYLLAIGVTGDEIKSIRNILLENK